VGPDFSFLYAVFAHLLQNGYLYEKNKTWQEYISIYLFVKRDVVIAIFIRQQPGIGCSNM